MDLEVRLGELSDVDALAPLWSGMVEHHRELIGHQWPVRSEVDAWSTQRQRYLDWLRAGTGILLLANHTGAPEPIGYALCRLHAPGGTFDLGAQVADVDSLAVSPAARGAGVGTALLTALRAELRSRGITYWSIDVVEANVGAAQLYERLGFRPWIRQLLAPVDGG
jgi:ribosomal protein S18 acetylase RimI-like enzyme